MRKTPLQGDYSCSMQKTDRKTANIPRILPLSKLEKLPQCKGYSLCKMVSMGETLKLP